MRRKDKEIKDKAEMEVIIKKAKVCRIAMCDGNIPYVVPVNFGYNDNSFYFHSATEGKKIEILKRNNNVCVEIDLEHEIIIEKMPCVSGTKYKSIIGFGKASLIENFEEKKNAMNIILNHCSEGKTFEFQEKHLKRVVLFKILIEQMTGKNSSR